MKINNEHNIDMSLKNFFNIGEDNIFNIPYYQRNYSWNDKEQVKMMLDDIFFYRNKNIKNKNNHFWGIIVSKKREGNFLEIIDGQQRVATLSLFFIAIIELFENSLLNQEYLQILNNFIKNKDNLNLKLQMENNNKDNLVYNSIVNNKKCPNIRNKLFKAYNYIKENLKNKIENTLQLNELLEKIFSTSIVHIILEEKEDNPQNVFESLNSKGMELSISDLVKNYIFMNISSSIEQKNYYTTYWIEIERGVLQKDSEIANFLRDYMVIKFEIVIEEMNKELYYLFREKIIFSDDNIKVQLEDILYWFNMFIAVSKNFLNGSLNDHEDFKKFEFINNVINKTFVYHDSLKLGYIIFMFVAEMYYSNIIDENKFKKIIELINNYIIMWSFKPSKGYLHNAFISFIKKINKERQNDSTLSNIDVGTELENCLKKNTNQFSILSEQDFKQLFISSTSQGLNTYICKFLEIRQINSPIKISNIVKSKTEKEWNIEHVMPQKPDGSLDWNKDSYYDESIWKMGNLFFIEKSINDKIENKSFKTKIKEYKNSNTILIKKINDLEEWNNSTITKNSEEKFELYKEHFKIEYKRSII